MIVSRCHGELTPDRVPEDADDFDMVTFLEVEMIEVQVGDRKSLRLAQVRFCGG